MWLETIVLPYCVSVASDESLVELATQSEFVSNLSIGLQRCVYVSMSTFASHRCIQLSGVVWCPLVHNVHNALFPPAVCDGGGLVLAGYH
jgi:hypothetical protein